jgi:GNAT superfamily N-acetyltransferase
MSEADRQINLDAAARFVPTPILRQAYVRYADSRRPDAPSYVSLQEQGLELGIVSSAVPEIARAVSSLLSCSLEEAKTTRGGHLPAPVVERVQREIISPFGVANLWGSFGHRFVMSRPVDNDTHEVVATLLVARRKGTIFFLTGRYNNLRHSQIEKVVDFRQPFRDDPAQRWFDLFALPEPARFKPKDYHHIANFVVARSARGHGLGELMLAQIVAKYARDHMVVRDAPILHCQHLLCGRGFWQIGDPPWLERMQRLGFYLRWGAESFFLEQDWAPLPPISRDGQTISNLEYNRSFGLPERYQGALPARRSQEHLLARIPEVVRLSQAPHAKLQYFQTLFDFVE